MRQKWILGIVLTGMIAAALWCFHRTSPPVSRKPAEKFTKPDIAHLPKAVPTKTVKMNIVGKPSAATPATVLVLEPSNWSVVQMIVNPQLAYERRLAAARSLSKHLTWSDWETLRPFLQKPDPLDDDQLGQVLKNQLMDVLCAQNPPPAGLGDLLADIFHDHKQAAVIRDYAVQHLAAYYEQMADQRGSAKTLEFVQKTLWEAVQEPVGSVGGTALLALKRLSQEYNDKFDQSRIAATALQMAGNPISEEFTRITAYQVCAQLRTVEALPIVLQAAQSGRTIPERMSAIAALGMLGGPDQISFLNELMQGNQERLKPAAQQALTRIASRQSQMTSQKSTF